MRVRVVRKLAEWVDGIDLRHCTVGDLIDLPDSQAQIIVAEGWALFARRAADCIGSTAPGEPLPSAVVERRRLVKDRRLLPRLIDVYQRLRDKREQIDGERRRLQRRSTD
jgi:hypothetical protein